MLGRGTLAAQVVFFSASRRPYPQGRRRRRRIPKWAENRAEKGKDNAQAAKASGRARGRTATETQKDAAKSKKDELDDALGDLNGSTNRLRRRFDPNDKWMETRPQVENVLDDGRKINQVMVRGKYGTQAERYWALLRESINDLARCYNLTPLGEQDPPPTLRVGWISATPAA